jgi:hypothetical protein
VSCCIISAIHRTFQEDNEMDMIRRLEPRDWLIAIVAFVAGAWIF